MPRVYPSQVCDLIERLFPGIVSKGEQTITSNDAPALTAIAALTREIPANLIALTGRDYTDFALGLGAIEFCLNQWQSVGLQRVADLRKPNGANPVLLLYRTLSNCPDDAASPETVEMAFITDANLRDSIRRDIAAADRDLVNGEWKGATVLAGAATEALLLWALQEKSKAADVSAAVTALIDLKKLSKRSDPTDPETWHLHEYIEVALHLKLISARAAKAAALAKDFRNLIHPGRSQRLGQVCDVGTAHQALAAVNLVARDLA